MILDVTSLLFSLSTALDHVEKQVVGVSHNHCRRVAALSVHLCKHMNMRLSHVLDMAICAILHDSALTEVSLEKSQDPLADMEDWRSHCTLGERTVQSFPFFQGDSRDIVLLHHENWDGSGFFAHTGTAISDRAAILRLADHVDLRFHLGQSTAESRARLYAHVQKESCRMYAPHIVEVFMECVDEAFLHSLTDEHIETTLTNMIPMRMQYVPPEDFVGIGQIFASIIDAKSHFTLNHTQGIARIAGIMATHYGFSTERASHFVVAAGLHDLGKLMTPENILEKPGLLTAEEYTVMKEHAQGTYDMLSTVRGLEHITAWSSQHHEKLDGTGYPFGLKAHQICFESRLLGCIDIYQALTEHRPYRTGMPHEKAMGILNDMAKQEKLDANIVADIDKVMQIYEQPVPASVL